MPDVVDLIRAKRDGLTVADSDIGWLIDAYTSGQIADEQMSAMAMAIFFRGLSAAELRAWTDAMIASGQRLDLSAVPAPTVDKHSTGGVGDKVSLILAPLGGELWRGGAPALRSRARPHGRDAGQAGSDTRLAGASDPERICRPAVYGRLCYLRGLR